MFVESHKKQTNMYSPYPTTTAAQNRVVLEYRECDSNTNSACIVGPIATQGTPSTPVSIGNALPKVVS